MLKAGGRSKPIHNRASNQNCTPHLVMMSPVQHISGGYFGAEQRRCRRKLSWNRLHKRTRHWVVFFAATVYVPARYVAVASLCSSVERDQRYCGPRPEA
jgi:hypothetical protein